MNNNWCPLGWKQVKLEDLGEVNRGRSRYRPRYAEHLYGGKYPFIQTGDIKSSNGKITTYQQTYSEAGLAQSRLWPCGTMCITIAANIAETAILTFPACFPDSVVGFIADNSKCDVFFVEYMFRYLKARIQREATGSVQDNINLATLNRLYFPLPPLSEQKAIAHILSSLDDKIELNRQMNETLEAMARAIFKSWFVDFDPVSAKRSGRQPAGMDTATADLFPDEFEESSLGLIPKGWKVGTLGKEIEIIKGKSYKSSELVPSSTALVTLKSFHRGGGYRPDGLKPYNGTYKPEQIIKPGELVVAYTDVTQAADVIGKPAIVKADERYNTLVASLDLGIIRVRNKNLNIAFLYYLFNQNDFQNHVYSHTNGSTVLHLSKDGIPSYEFCLPHSSLISKFERIISPIFEKSNINWQ